MRHRAGTQIRGSVGLGRRYGVVALLVTALVAPPARAQTPEWRFDRFRPIEGSLVANAYLATIALLVVGRAPEEPRWTGGILADEPVRRALRLRSREMRTTAARVSDVLLFGSVVYPLVVDSLLVAAVAHDDPDLAAQMTLVTAEAFAVMRLFTDATKLLVARQRPFDRECRRDPSYSPGCFGRSSYQSFVSGHSIAAFTAAFLTCTQHTYLPLYGAPWDAVACGGTLAAAATTGLLRILGDHHYLSDVLAGAALGAVAGFLVPWALHYRTDHGSRAERTTGAELRRTPRPGVSLPLLALPWP